MAGNKDSFVLYHDIREPLELLTMEERGEIFSAILDYSEYGTVPDFGNNAGLKMAFAFIKTALDRDSAKWEKKIKARSEAGKKGMESRYGKRNGDNKT